MSQATGVAGAYQGPVRVVSPLEPSIGQSWWAPIEQMRPRKGLARLNFVSHEIAGRHSVYPPLGYYHTFEKQMFGRTLSRVFTEAGLELVAGAGGRAEPFSPGLACLLASRGASARPRRGADGELAHSPWARGYASSALRSTPLGSPCHNALTQGLSP